MNHFGIGSMHIDIFLIGKWDQAEQHSAEHAAVAIFSPCSIMSKSKNAFSLAN